MSTIYCTFVDTIKGIFGGFGKTQMIAIGAIVLIALLLGFFIGALVLYGVGIKKGKEKGMIQAALMAKRSATADAGVPLDEASLTCKR